MLNQCNFIGRLGRDPETRSVSDTTVTSFSLACSKQWKNKSGEKQEKTEWVNCQAWGKLGGIVQEYAGKGDTLFVSGEMETRKYQDKDGNDRYATSINVREMKMLTPKGDRSNQGDTGGGGGTGPDMGEVPF